MRKIVLTEWISLDGFTSGASNDMSFVGESFNEEMGKYEDSFLKSGDLLILGRETYESFAGAWPEREKNSEDPGERDYAKYLNNMKKIVISKSLKSADWTNCELWGELDIKKLKALKKEEGKNIIIYGSASVVQQLTNAELIDEYQLLIHPILLSAGKCLFKDVKGVHRLKLTDSKVFKSGVVVLTYQLKGAEA